MLACLLAGCSTQAPSPRPTQTATEAPGNRLTWMLTRAALASVLSDPAARSRLAGAPVYEILRTGQSPLGAAGAVPVVTFAALGELAQAVSGGGLPTGTRAVLYDPEVWPFTPVAEQRDPAQAARQALRLAHAHGLQLFVAPALNLTTLRPAPARAGSSSCTWAWPGPWPGWPMSSNCRPRAWNGTPAATRRSCMRRPGRRGRPTRG